MNDPNADYPSGRWTGFYQQAGGRFRQDLDLHFAGGVITGGGSDPVGTFTIKGSYEPGSGDVRWTKRYTSGHSVYYRGFREGKGIWGTWQIPPFQRSGFHVWPLAAGEAAGAAAVAEQVATNAPPSRRG